MYIFCKYCSYLSLEGLGTLPPLAGFRTVPRWLPVTPHWWDVKPAEEEEGELDVQRHSGCSSSLQPVVVLSFLTVSVCLFVSGLVSPTLPAVAHFSLESPVKPAQHSDYIGALC